MPTSSPPLSVTERRALADLLAELGPDAPTLCEGWQTRHLAAHLVVRDRRPDAMPGFTLGGPLAAWTQRVEAGARTGRDYAGLVADVRSGPPFFLPTAWAPLDKLVNTAEFAIHHEDVRRAQPDWTPRELPREVQDLLWPSVAFSGRARAAKHPGALVLRRSDVPATDGPRVEKRAGSGTPTTTVEGEPLELLLWASGREQAARVQVQVQVS